MRRTLVLLLTILLIAGCTAPETDAGPDEPSEPRAATTTATGSGCPGTVAAESTTGGADEELSTVSIAASGGDRVEVEVELADSPRSRYLGLRYRENLGADRGMLFVYEAENQLNYTMEDTLVPLSIAFMDSRRRIIDIQDMEPQTPGPYRSAEPARYALEVNRGFFERCGVEVGDRARLPV